MRNTFAGRIIDTGGSEWFGRVAMGEAVKRVVVSKHAYSPVLPVSKHA
jgi:hypothetical protein